MTLYPLTPAPAEPAPASRAYPSSLSDAEWAVLAPLLKRPATPKGAGHPRFSCPWRGARGWMKLGPRPPADVVGSWCGPARTQA
jgi:hypothetical protein